MTSNIARRALLLGVPLAVLLLELTHPVDWSGHTHGLDLVADDPRWWTILHVLQLPLFGLLGLAVLALTWGERGHAVTVSRVGVAFFVVFYAAYDSITGIGSGLVISEGLALGAEEAETAKAVARSLFLGGGPLTFIPLLGMLGWLAAVGAAAVSLSRRGATRVPVGFLALAAVAFGITHEPPFGPAGMAAFLMATASLEFAPQYAWRRMDAPTVGEQSQIVTRTELTRGR